MNHYKTYMLDIPYVHVFVNTDHKILIRACAKVNPNMSLIINGNWENASFDQSIYYKNILEKRITPLIFECILKIKKIIYSSFSWYC